MPASRPPVVSAITIFLNARKYISEALESVVAQTYPHWELLLVDDGSDDGSTEIAQSFAGRYSGRVHYLEHPGHANRGMSASRNLAIAHAQGDYVAFLDADDVWLPHKLSDQVALLETHPEAGMVYGSTILWFSWTGHAEDASRDYRDFVEHRGGVSPNSIVSLPFLLRSFLHDGASIPLNCSLLVRTALCRSIGGFEEDFRGMYEDQVFLAKVALSAPILVASGCWAKYRQHSSSCCAEAYQTKRARSARLAFLTWLKTYLQKIHCSNQEVWRILEKELSAHQYPTAPISILEVNSAALPQEGLRGFNIEAPQAGTSTDGFVVELFGWVLPNTAAAKSVDIYYQDSLVQRLAVTVPRPDIALAFPDVPHAEQSGFRAMIDFAGLGSFSLHLRAVLQDETLIHLGSIKASRKWRDTDLVLGADLVSVVIFCQDDTAFLPDAITSVLTQSYPCVELIVADAGLVDNTPAIVATFPAVCYLEVPGEDRANAKNKALKASKGSFIVFLSPDDKLSPDAISVALNLLSIAPASAFVAGRFRDISDDGSPLPTSLPLKPEQDAYAALLRDNFLPFDPVVLFQRISLIAAGGFHSVAAPAEAYEAYLRLARDYPVLIHTEVVAERRRSRLPEAGLTQARSRAMAEILRAQTEYCRCKDIYAYSLADGLSGLQADTDGQQSLRSPAPAVGTIDFADLRALFPLGSVRASDPSSIYSTYLRFFFAENAAAIHGNVLEISDSPSVCEGSPNVRSYERLEPALFLSPESRAGALADLSRSPSFYSDCIIAANLLNRVYHPENILRMLFDLLQPGGALLVVVPGIAPKDRSQWGSSSLWGFTQLSLEGLFRRTFPEADIEIGAKGNVLSAAALLHRLDATNLDRREINFRDTAYEVLIGARVRKPSVSKSPVAAADTGATSGPSIIGPRTSPLLKAPVILLYHRVSELSSDPWNLCVAPQRFAEHMQILREYARPLPLKSFSPGQHLQDPASVFVTFDDGYADNLYNAKPVIERFDIPATFFLSTSLLGSPREFWWDDLERLLLKPPVLPCILQLTVGETHHQWTLVDEPADPISPHSRNAWKAWFSPLTRRHLVYSSVCRLFRSLLPDLRDKLLDEIRDWAGLRVAGRATHRLLTPDEVLALADDARVEIGAHTVTHSSLAVLPAELQLNEAQHSKRILEDLLQRPLTSFAYPYGGRTDFTEQSVAAVRSAGFSRACSAFVGPLYSATDPFSLPRLYVEDWSGEEFARRLSALTD